jgi:hypothetical protein
VLYALFVAEIGFESPRLVVFRKSLWSICEIADDVGEGSVIERPVSMGLFDLMSRFAGPSREDSMSKKALAWSPLFLFATVSGVAVLACGAGSNGVNGTSTLVNTTPEPAGANCPNGGTRIDVGEDTNNNGTLDSGEIKQTRYVCAGTNGTNGTNGSPGTNGKDGKDGTAYLITTATEPPGTNCAEGGVKVQSGADTNGDGVLDGNEATTTYVCNGSDPNGDGGALANTFFASGSTNSSAGTAVTPISGSLTVPASGSIVAIGSVDAFCAQPALSAGYDCAAAGTITDGYVTISTSATAIPNSGDPDYFYLTPNDTEALTRTAVFPVTAGSNTIYMRAEAANNGQIGFYRAQLTLLFIPHA